MKSNFNLRLQDNQYITPRLKLTLITHQIQSKISEVHNSNLPPFQYLE